MGAITRGIANNILGNGAVDGTDALTGTIPATNIGNPSLANLTTFPPSVDGGIPQVAGDPPAPSDGDVWYNTNTYKLKVRGVSAALGTWATGGNLNTGRNNLGGAGVDNTSALVFGGHNDPPYFTNTESYNGTSWTEVNDLNTAVGINSGTGTQTSALSMAGEQVSGNTAQVESWNGTSWTTTTSLNAARRDIWPAGSDNTSALATGGRTPAAVGTRACEQWNGSTWTEVNDINDTKTRYGGAGNGTVTSALISGGYSVPTTRTTDTESWNGTSWTEVSDLNNVVSGNQGAGADNTSALSYGGSGAAPTYSPTTQTELWNGTSWTVTSSMSTARGGNAGNGTTSSAFSAGGNTPPRAQTEEWNAGAGNLNVDLA